MAVQTFDFPDTFTLESGDTLAGISIAYQTFGQINASKSNVIWVCHALTANADVADWWPGFFGRGNFMDPEKYFIVCANILGSCYGSTYALSENPQTGEPYYHSFPFISIRDMAKAHDILRQYLGIEHIFMAIGGSLGGQQVLEWAISQPTIFKHIIPVATNARHSPWGIAFNESQRMAITADHSWKESHPKAGLEGMKAARAMALISYRAYQTYGLTQQDESESLEHYRASSYQQYQGEKLAKRFDAFAYWTLSKAMDSHNIGRGRNGIPQALSMIQAKCLTIAIDSDVLFPKEEQQLISRLIPNGKYVELHSVYGHDGFLIETAQLNKVLFNYIDQLV